MDTTGFTLMNVVWGAVAGLGLALTGLAESMRKGKEAFDWRKMMPELILGTGAGIIAAVMGITTDAAHATPIYASLVYVADIARKFLTHAANDSASATLNPVPAVATPWVPPLLPPKV